MDQGYINSRVRGMYRSLLGPDGCGPSSEVYPEGMIADLSKTYRSAPGSPVSGGRASPVSKRRCGRTS